MSAARAGAPAAAAGSWGSAAGRIAGQWRWTLLLVFVAGMLPALTPLPRHAVSVVWLNAASLAACAVLLVQLRQPPRRVLWAWVILMVFILGYYLKSMVFAASFASPEFRAVNTETNWVTLDDMAAGLKPITAAFCAFCLTAALMIEVTGRAAVWRRADAVPDERVRWTRVDRMVVLALVLGLATSVLPIMLGFATMGAAPRPLPFRLDAVVTRMRLSLVPGMLLLALWLGDRPGRGRRAMVPLLAVLLLAALDSVVRASRGSLVNYTIPVFFLWTMTGRLTPRKKMLGGALLALVVLLYPVLTGYRVFRSVGYGTSAAFATAARLASDQQNQELVRASAMHMGTRFSGADAVWATRAYLHSHAAAPPSILPKLIDYTDFGDWYTRQVAGITNPFDFRPPTLVGTALLVGGEGGVVFLIALYTVLAGAAWTAIARLRFAPVALALYAAMLFGYSSEGVMGLQDPISLVVTLMAMAAIYRYLTRRSAARHAYAPALAAPLGPAAPA